MIQRQELAYQEQQAIIQKQDLVYHEQQGLIRKQQDAEIDRLIALLGNGDSGSSKKPPCLDGTRTSILKWISKWIEQPSDDGRYGLCLIGAVGRGKSLVGASVVEAARTSKRLGGEFYFIVDEQDRNKGIIPVLARQLASWGDRRLRVEIASAIDDDREIVQRSLEVQFKKLIREPLETLAEDVDCDPLVMIFDGLDECDDQYATRLLRLIGQSFTTLPTHVRIIITSRPEPHLLHQYDAEPLDSRLHVRSLDLEDVGEVEKDIEAFLKQELPQMVWGMVKRPSNWPGEERRIILIRLSGGLWIWVVIVARMLADPRFRDPEKQLNALLLSASDADGEYGQNTDLYAIYSQIMNRACPPNSHSELLTLFRDVLGALCVAEKPINTHTLASLLCLDHLNSVDLTDSLRTKVLGYLQSVLIVPDVEEDDLSRDAKPIQFVHRSFKDYLTDQKRCEARFLVNIVEQHRRVAIRCLRHMEDLQKPNICDIDPSMLNSEIGKHGGPCSDDGDSSEDGDSNDKNDDESSTRASDDVRRERDGRINPTGIDDDLLKCGEKSAGSKRDEGLDIRSLTRRHISSALQYACENWAMHVSGTSPECDDVYASVDTLARTRLLYWLEVLSLLEMTRGVVRLVRLVEVWLKARPQQVMPDSSVSPTPKIPGCIATFITKGLVNAQTQLQTNIIHTTSGPLSLRALDHVRRFLADLLPVQHPGVRFQASVLPTESDIPTLSLLQDFKNFFVEFQDPIRTSAPHIYLSALPFTPSHTSLSRVYGHLAEGGPKPRRGCPQQWPGKHPCVAWSPDGQRIISGSQDGTLCLWDPSTGARVVEAWKSHTNVVVRVSWSPDGKMIVSGSSGDTIQLWDSTSGARIGEEWKGHTSIVMSLAWSPDSKWVVSGSFDKTLRLWDPSTGAAVGEAWKENRDVWCVAWSPDGKRIASGLTGGDGIHLWDPSKGAVVGRLGVVNAFALAWSPDGQRIVSVDLDGDLYMWDVGTGERIGKPWQGHTGVVLCVAWSPDGKRIVSGSRDKTLRLWDASTGAPIGNAWRGHTDDVRSVGWSPDGKTIVSGSLDGPLILWNSHTGEPFRLGQTGTNNHTRHVYRLAFAPNSNKIVTASSDGTLRLWDMLNGVLVGYLVR
ncbi:hypothetical protein FRB95_012536 [Tulasnella sp. JGI-2019a]|nr:hypothetical protein FRB95_012536 [Tulasnella sp. JGI-2019a]